LRTPSRTGATTFGDLLRDHRVRRGFSQEYLAEKAGISLDAVSSLERGTRRAPYRHTLALLRSALELDPADTIAFETAASRGRARPRATTAARHGANNLPAQFSSFVGRETDVADVSRLVGEHCLVSMVGAAGIGKTRIALRVATELLGASFESAWFVDLASLRDPAHIPAAILSALNLPETPDRAPLADLIGHLRSKSRVLVILDNCEHLVHGAAVTAEAILQGCPGVTMLATSREVLGLAGERVVRLPTLSVSDAVALFVERASEADSRFALTEQLEPAIAEICRRLDGIALAIELAAARVNVLSPIALAQNINERFLILTAGKRGAPPRHRTLRAMLDWSYNLIDVHEQRILRQLAVFVNGFTPDLAAELFAHEGPIDEHDMRDVLGSLVDKSLVHYESRYDTTRYRLLESTRQYAKEKLREHDELDAARRAHALAILALVGHYSPLHFVPDRVWKTQAQPEVDNWRAAMAWAFGHRGDRLIGLRLAAAISDVWFPQAAEARRWLEQAMEVCDESVPAELRAKLELAQVIISYPLGRAQTDATLAAVQRALGLYEEAGDRLGAAAAQVFLGERLLFKGNIADAEQLLRAALAAAEAGGASRLIAMATRYLGIARGFSGDVHAARELIRAAVALYVEGGATSNGRAIQGLNLAEFEFAAGDPETALRLARESIETYREYHFTFGLCGVLSNMAAYAVALARFDEARGYAREALALAREGGFDLQFAWVSQHLAAIAALQRADLLRAARALGFVDARLVELERRRGFTEQQEYDTLMNLLRAELGEQLDALMREGARWSKDQALRGLADA
jgi:predicted ATPase/transcriptional regulator with XRE-family HTH domain